MSWLQCSIFSARVHEGMSAPHQLGLGSGVNGVFLMKAGVTVVKDVNKIDHGSGEFVRGFSCRAVPYPAAF